MVERWLAELSETLGVPNEMDEKALLDAARVVAHSVERRAAPLSTFLIGVAAASTGASVQELADRTVAAARAFAPDEE